MLKKRFGKRRNRQFQPFKAQKFQRLHVTVAVSCSAFIPQNPKRLQTFLYPLLRKPKKFYTVAVMASSSSLFRTGISSMWRFSATHQISAASECRQTMYNGICKVQCCSLHNKRRGSPAYSEVLSYIGGYSDPGLEQKQLIDKFINFCTSDGEKTKARAIAYQALHRLAQTEGATKLLVQAVGNIKPVCEVSKVRVAGTTYQVPDIVDRDRQQTLALRWILGAALKRRTSNKIGLDQCLSAEILDAYRKKGIARKKRDDLHELASTHRSFVHFRWW